MTLRETCLFAPNRQLNGPLPSFLGFDRPFDLRHQKNSVADLPQNSKMEICHTPTNYGVKVQL